MARVACSFRRMLVMTLAGVLAVALFPIGPADAGELRGASDASGASVSTQASSYKGLYERTYGDLDSWGGFEPTPEPGYILSLEILKKKKKSVTFVFSQAYFYGTVGSYIATSRKVKAKLKNGKGSFTFRSSEGDKGKGRIKLVSKKKVKVRFKTTVTGHERIPLSTGGKYRTLKRAKQQYHLFYV